MITYSEDEFGYLMAQACQWRGRRELFCGPTVLEWLKETTVPAEPVKAGAPIPLALLMGIDIILDEKSQPSEFRLIQHDNCAISANDVTHGRCSILADGLLTL